MTTSKKSGTFAVIHHLWMHSRPHTKRMRTRFTFGSLGAFAIVGTEKVFHLSRWWFVLPFLVIFGLYLLYEFLVFLGSDIAWEARIQDEKLGELLASPDLHQRFTALRLGLRETDAASLSQLQNAMEFGAREAQRLAEEIRKYEGRTLAVREQQDKDRKSAEALSELLDCQIGRVAEMIEHKGRRNQWIILIMGAILGVVVQALAQWIF